MNDLEKSIAEKLLANIHLKISRALNPVLEVEVYSKFLETVALRRQISGTPYAERPMAMPDLEPQPEQKPKPLPFWKKWRLFW